MHNDKVELIQSGENLKCFYIDSFGQLQLIEASLTDMTKEKPQQPTKASQKKLDDEQMRRKLQDVEESMEKQA